MIVTKEEFDELSSMVEEIHKYIFSERFTPRRGEVRMTSTELKDILNIPHNTYYVWLRKGLLPRRQDISGFYFIASEVDQALIERRIIREDRYVEEFRRNYIYDVR